MKTIIEINGHKYDARTGELLAEDPITQESRMAAIPSSPKPLENIGSALDGINRRPSEPLYNKPVHAPAAHSQHNQIQPSLQNSSDNFNAHPVVGQTRLTQRSTEKSKTLLRSVVKKPQARPGIHSASAQNLTNNGQSPLIPNRQSLASDKMHSTAHIARDPNVRRFGIVPKNITKVVNGLSVAQMPKMTESAPPAPPAISKHDTKETKPQVFNHKVSAIDYHFSSRLPKQNSIRRAAKHLRVKPKVLGICAVVLAVVLLGGFFAYQNIPSVAIRVAAKGAGFNGRLPSNIPSGFSFKGPITYTKGSISLNYKSNSDDRKFSITQKPTAWTSESLLTNYLVASKYRYQTYRDSGLTVFVFNEGNATWVDKGIWYNIAGEGTLSSDQILAIAGGM